MSKKFRIQHSSRCYIDIYQVLLKHYACSGFGAIVPLITLDELCVMVYIFDSTMLRVAKYRFDSLHFRLCWCYL